MTMPERISRFSELVDWLLKEHHEGHPYRMAKALGVSSALPFQWRDGTVKAPSPPTIARLCEVYELDYDAVLKIIYPAPSSGAVRRGGTSPFSRRAGRAFATAWREWDDRPLDWSETPITRRIMSILDDEDWRDQDVALLQIPAVILGRLTNTDRGEKISTPIGCDFRQRSGAAYGLAC